MKIFLKDLCLGFNEQNPRPELSVCVLKQVAFIPKGIHASTRAPT